MILCNHFNANYETNTINVIHNGNVKWNISFRLRKFFYKMNINGSLCHSLVCLRLVNLICSNLSPKWFIYLKYLKKCICRYQSFVSRYIHQALLRFKIFLFKQIYNMIPKSPKVPVNTALRIKPLPSGCYLCCLIRQLLQKRCL